MGDREEETESSPYGTELSSLLPSGASRSSDDSKTASSSASSHNRISSFVPRPRANDYIAVNMPQSSEEEDDSFAQADSHSNSLDHDSQSVSIHPVSDSQPPSLSASPSPSANHANDRNHEPVANNLQDNENNDNQNPRPDPYASALSVAECLRTGGHCHRQAFQVGGFVFSPLGRLHGPSLFCSLCVAVCLMLFMLWSWTMAVTSKSQTPDGRWHALDLSEVDRYAIMFGSVLIISTCVFAGRLCVTVDTSERAAPWHYKFSVYFVVIAVLAVSAGSIPLGMRVAEALVNTQQYVSVLRIADGISVQQLPSLYHKFERFGFVDGAVSKQFNYSRKFADGSSVFIVPILQEPYVAPVLNGSNLGISTTGTTPNITVLGWFCKRAHATDVNDAFPFSDDGFPRIGAVPETGNRIAMFKDVVRQGVTHNFPFLEAYEHYPIIEYIDWRQDRKSWLKALSKYGGLLAMCVFALCILVPGLCVFLPHLREAEQCVSQHSSWVPRRFRQP